MGYSKSKRAIRRVEPYLQQMLQAEGEISFPAEDPSDFAYRLRDGIASAKAFSHEDQKYATFASLNAKYLIRVKGGLVICEPRDLVPVAKLRELGRVTINDAHNTLEIVGAAIKHKAPVMIFPNVDKSSVDVRLYRWATNSGYFVIVADSHVTLTREDPGELAWKP